MLKIIWFATYNVNVIYCDYCMKVITVWFGILELANEKPTTRGGL